jgi:hypothetical protein
MRSAVLFTAVLSAHAQDSNFFEAKIRPVLASKCIACHSSSMKAPMGGLALDTRAGLAKVITANRPEDSRLFIALGFSDPHLQMPPSGKLPEAVIADFRQWIAAGAHDPRNADSPSASAALRGMALAEGKKWWAFQPVSVSTPAAARNATQSSNKIDAFIRAALEAKGFKPSPPAGRRTLARRAYVDLVGFKPSFEEVESFAADLTPDAWGNLIDRLLASPQYGERWGRHWMDVARFGEDNATNEATNPPFPFAWRYRDWIIESLNRDLPYDRFVKLQLAADLMPGTSRADLRALGYLGAAPVYHKDQRLSGEVIGAFLADDWDERVDATTKGLLGLTVACARCHDHKFDAISTKDYHALAGVFASTLRTEQPMFNVDPGIEQRFFAVQRRLIDLSYSVRLLTNEASTLVDSASRVARWKAEIEVLREEMQKMQETQPRLVSHLERYWQPPPPKSPPPPPVSPEPFMNTVFDAAQYIDASDPQYTFVAFKPGEARDLPVFRGGNVALPGEVVPRRIPSVLAKDDRVFRTGSGRLEFAERLFSDAEPLLARVIVNRVWAWHFGRGLVATPSDFGVQGEKPTHPELLSDLAARFIAAGWSLKWLHREIMMSDTYRQSNRSRPAMMKADPVNSQYWRFTPRRLSIEAFRDSILRASGRLDSTPHGPSLELDAKDNRRRTVYARVSRYRLNPLFKQYDFPDPMYSSGMRELTTTPIQQLFVLNSPFFAEAAKELAREASALESVELQVSFLYRRILARDADGVERGIAAAYLGGNSLELLAHTLLASNEVILWP